MLACGDAGDGHGVRIERFVVACECVWVVSSGCKFKGCRCRVATTMQCAICQVRCVLVRTFVDFAWEWKLHSRTYTRVPHQTSATHNSNPEPRIPKPEIRHLAASLARMPKGADKSGLGLQGREEREGRREGWGSPRHTSDLLDVIYNKGGGTGGEEGGGAATDGASALIETPTPTVAAAAAGGVPRGVRKGVCGVCGQGVWSSEARLRDARGRYWHEACRSQSSSSAPSIGSRIAGRGPFSRAKALASPTQRAGSRLGGEGGASAGHERAQEGKRGAGGGWAGAAAVDADDGAVTSLAAQWGPLRAPKPSPSSGAAVSPRDVTDVGTSTPGSCGRGGGGERV